MFSVNHKISSRQLYRNYAAGFISLSALLPPLVMNRDNLTGVILSLVFLGIFLAGSAVVGRPQSAAVKCLCYAHYWILGTMLAHMTGLLVQDFLLTDTPLWIVLGWFYLICYYNLYKGLECRVRISEILFPFFVFLLACLSFLMQGEVEVRRLSELNYSMGLPQIRIGYELFCWFGAVQSLWHLHGQVQDERRFQKGIGKVWLTGTAAAVLWSLFTYCIYGNAGHTGLVFPLANAMTLAHFPGNVIGRMDTLFVFAWIIGLFLLCSSLFAPLADGEPDRRHRYLLAALLAASFAFSMQPECMEWGRKFLYYISTPVQILLLLFYGLKGNGRRLAAACVVLVPVLFLNGCGAQELEEESIVTAVGVDAGNDEKLHFTFCFGKAKDEEDKEPFEVLSASLSDAKEMYWQSDWKHMDFNHLKNIYFSDQILETAVFKELLTEIQVDGAYSRGILVYITDGAAAEQAKKEEQPEDGTPIHRLLNDWYNEGKIWQSSE